VEGAGDGVEGRVEGAGDGVEEESGRLQGRIEGEGVVSGVNERDMAGRVW
jgi:hypothetical protein